jgi:reticulocyte binding protein (fragment)
LITFYDERGNGYGAQVELTTKNAVNGERSISGTIVSNKQVLSKLDRGWSFTFDGELYKIIYAKPKDEGRNISLSFDAVHQFFYDFEHSNCYKEFNGSNRFEVYIEEIFKNSGYRYVIEAEAKAIRKENFGNASRLKMFKDIIKAAGLEFSVTGKVVRILKKVGTDLSTVVRKNFNMNELTIEKNIGNFITYKKGFGAWKDEKNHDAGRYTSEYESPLARIYGRIEGEPVTDERYKETGKLLERLKFDVDNSYAISVQLDMEDLTQAGYEYTRPRAGDYIMAINETIGFREKIRIVSYESSYDVTGRLLSHKVTCNDIGTVQKAITSEGSIMRNVSESKQYAEGALEVATRALVSANGKNTNYYGTTKPKDEPRGTLHEGDLLYLTVGEETELYYWSGSEWLPKILKVDTKKIETLLSEAQTATNKAIEQANATAREALAKAGTLPNTDSLSAKIKEEILKSKDLSDKINRTFTENDNGTEIFNKISGEVTKKLVEVEGQVNQKINQTNQRIGEMSGSVNSSLYSMNNQLGEMNNGLNKAKIDIVNAQGTANNVGNKLILTNQKVDQANSKIEQTGRDLANTNAQVEANKRQIEVQVTNYNAVRESTKLFERILGTTEEGAPDKLSRLVMSSDIFQTEVGKYVTDDNNLIVNSMSMSTNTLVGNNNPNASVSVADGIFSIKAQGLTSYNWTGFTLPIYVKKIYRGETYTLGFKYRIKEYPDGTFAFNIKNHGLNKILLSSDIGKNRPPLNEWQEFQKTFTVQEDFAFGEDKNYPFYIYLAKNGWIEFKEPILVRGSNTGPYKPSQFDDAFAETKALGSQLTSKIGEVSSATDSVRQLAYTAQSRAEQASARSSTALDKAEDAKMDARQATSLSQTAKQTALDAQQKAIEVAEQAQQAQATAEATRTQVTQLAGSWAVRNLNSAGDVIGQINLNKDGSVKINDGLIVIGENTYIKNGVIDSASIKTLSASKISGGEADFSTFRAINFDAGAINTGILRGIDIRGVTLGSIDESFMIDTPKNEIRFDNHTLLTFYNQNDGTVSMIGSGDRASNTQGSGLLIGVDIDSATATRLKNQQNNRDLWTARTGTATSILMGTRANGRGVIEQLTTGEVSIGISEAKTSTAPQAYIKIGDINNRYFTSKISTLSDFLNVEANERLLLNIKDLTGTWSGNASITQYGSFHLDSRDGVIIDGHGKGSVKVAKLIATQFYATSIQLNNKDLVASFNRLADFVVAIAKHAKWGNVGDYRI